MVQCGNRERFTLESAAEFLGGHLDGDNAIESRIDGAIHLPHSAGADEALDSVWAQMRASREPRSL
jgi:hypothetical protein